MTRKGFTLIELLVVIAIIGLLSTFAIVALGTARLKARDARRVADLKQIQTALELFASDNNGSYPSTSSTLGDSTHACLNNLGFQPASCTGTVYLAALPKDPQKGYYFYSGSGTDFLVSASLEGTVNNLSGVIATSPNTGVYNLSSGLVERWRFDEGSGTTAVDSNGFGNATWYGNTPYYSSGQVGLAGNFDGATNYLSVANSGSNLSAFTMSVWLNGTFSSDKTFINGNNFRFICNSSYLYFHTSSLNFYTVGFTPPNGTWFHVVFTYDGSVGKVYINGNQNATAVLGSFVAGTPFLIGEASTGYQMYNGLMDDLQIYGRALTGTEVQALYNSQR